MKPNDEYGQFTGPGEVRIMRTLPGPIERIWQYLTDPEKRSRWFAGGPMELHVGGKVELFFQHKIIAPGEIPPEKYAELHNTGFKMPGTILRCEPPRILSYTFDDNSDVTFELFPQDAKVLLILTHRARGEDLPSLSGYASGWHAHFALLIAQLEGTPPPPFWAMHARLKLEYEKALKS
jgi:uncharacterized protein YndB with AHSA1/START domain